MAWTKSSTQEVTKDARGWPKGKGRKWTKGDEKKVRSIYRSLQKDSHQFYLGATAIAQEWRNRYSRSTPPLRTIGGMLRALGLSKRRRKDRHKGASRYLCYPEYTIYTLFGGRVLEADFIGKKYIAGRTAPLHFVGFSFKKAPKLRDDRNGLTQRLLQSLSPQARNFSKHLKRRIS